MNDIVKRAKCIAVGVVLQLLGFSPIVAGTADPVAPNFVNGVGMEMIRVEPGQVEGTLWEWGDGWVNRGVRQISLSLPYYLGKTEVTQGQWEAVMDDNPSHFKGADLPVENVTWHEAMKFCQRLTERERAAGRLPEGYTYTLPTEEQWEYAGRAGTSADFAGALEEMAWYGETSSSRTHPVGTKMANAWGFHDMHGNVLEWCLDEYGRGHAIRGGGWFHYAESCRLGYRFWSRSGYRLSYLGFRVAAVPAIE